MEDIRLNGKTLKVIRSILDLTQEDIGNLTGITKVAVWKIENGETKKMSATNTQKVIEALNLTPREFAAVQSAIRTVESKFDRITQRGESK